MDIDPKTSIHAFLNELVALREELEARHKDLEARFERRAAKLQPCATAFREFQDAAQKWEKAGGTLARMISEVLLGSLPSPDDKGV